MCKNQQKPQQGGGAMLWNNELRSRSYTHQNHELRSWSGSIYRTAPQPWLDSQNFETQPAYVYVILTKMCELSVRVHRKTVGRQS